MIERGDFAIEDLFSKKDVNFSSPWESCFSPGQKVGMSMVFVGFETSIDCPKCHTKPDDTGLNDQDVEW